MPINKSQYIFILGNNPALSVAEIMAILPGATVIKRGDEFLVAEAETFDVYKVMAQLGGTIKIGTVVGDKLEKEKVVGEIISRRDESKVNFGFSYYQTKPTNFGMEIKKELRNRGISCRLVVSREITLSSVIVKKEKCLDFLVLPEFLGLTLAVQDFEEYGRRDFGRPASDAFSGMLPPKAAKMMINLARASREAILLDPFCGSGTVLTEAVAMGYENLIGSDISAKAVADTKKNLEWITANWNLKLKSWEVFTQPVEKLSSIFKKADAIVTEPYLGPALKGQETDIEVKKIKEQLEKIYLAAFDEFRKIVKPGGRVVMVIPQWHLKNLLINLNIFAKTELSGFKRIDAGDLIYKRADQKVWRIISVWEKKI